MWYLLNLEWKKFKHFRTFKVMLILYLILLPVTLIVAKAFFGYVKPPESFIVFGDIYKFPGVWAYLAYIGNWLSFFFLGFIGVQCVTMEFTNKTLRQNIINGITRNEFFLSKILLVATVSLFATIYFALVGFSFGLLSTDNLYYTKIVSGTSQIFYFYLMCLGYMIFGLFLGVLIRRTGLSLFLFLVYIIFLEPMLRWALHYRYIPNKSMHFYPLNAIEDLSPIPIPDIITNLSEENNLSIILSQTEASITTVIYLSIFTFIIYWKIKKSDL